jgi:hypothetical protein
MHAAADAGSQNQHLEIFTHDSSKDINNDFVSSKSSDDATCYFCRRVSFESLEGWIQDRRGIRENNPLFNDEAWARETAPARPRTTRKIGR